MKKKRITKPKKVSIYGFRVHMAAVVIYYLLVLPFVLVFTVKHAPEIQRSGKQFGSIVSGEPADTLAGGITDSVINAAISQSSASGDIRKGFAEGYYLGKRLGQQQAAQELKKGPAKVNELKQDLITKETINPETNNESVHIDLTIPENTRGDDNSYLFQIRMFLLAILIGGACSIPFRRYLWLKARNRQISPRLQQFCKKWIVRLPTVYSSVLGAAFIIGHLYLVNSIMNTAQGQMDAYATFNKQFIFVSLIASLVVVTFAWFWTKHRVQLKYLEHFFTDEELRIRIFKTRSGRIRTKLWVSSSVSTLLPLVLVMIYLYQSRTTISDLNIDLRHNNPVALKILFGDFGESFVNVKELEDSFYINAINALIMFIGIWAGVVVSLIYIFYFVKWNTEDIVIPLKELLAKMRDTSNGELERYALVRTNDEIGQLTEGYNEMVARLSNYISNINKLNEAYYRFVPRQFLDMLNKESITEISLGDQVEKEMTVLFTDIRDFTGISETLTLQQNFDFINNYLGLMEPIIAKNHGFIDKYMGDSIMALFPGNVENAIRASVEMRQTLEVFNQVRKSEGDAPIEMGIGLHTGTLMLGVVGGHGRMEGTVISDAVNLASRLEGLTKVYSAALIISQDTLIRLENPLSYQYRFLDIVKVKGKKESVYIFEIMDAEWSKESQLKIAQRKKFSQAIEAYRRKEFVFASDLFTEILNENPNDGASKLYLSRCQKNQQVGIPEDWDGIEVMNTK